MVDSVEKKDSQGVNQAQQNVAEKNLAVEKEASSVAQINPEENKKSTENVLRLDIPCVESEEAKQYLEQKS